ncbi:substrate-binding domain-containing protein [Paenibacillus alkaliterrae]|uniref:substrate-binding domain-containing protein n=1 Tax=Paenibacillus alkaliterrae TaxID=320909 RepID=UPI001F454D3B|nr:substrate-binding domain-containing protein [Paenibacillus alkaliterrae]MCF2938004.1 substrate-binding domain-containing protein [Paenibacillus alkaliterrae]
MTIRKPVLLAVFLIIVIGFFAVYGIEAFRLTNPKETRITIVLKTNHVHSEFWQTVSTGVQAAAKEFGVIIDIKGPLSEMDSDEQIRMIDEAIAQKPDAFILAAADYSKFAPSAEKIRESGAKLILIDSPIPINWADSFLATDHVEAGKKAGISLAGHGNGESFKVVAIGDRNGTAAEEEREAGFRQVLSDLPEVEYVGVYYFEGTEDTAYERVKKLLTLYPDIQGIIALNEKATLGAAKAIKEKKWAQKIKIIGFDSSIYVIKLLEEGIIHATVVQKPFNMGYLSIETAVKALNGVKVNPRVDLGSNVITSDNMYTKENQELLFPLVEK